MTNRAVVLTYTEKSQFQRSSQNQYVNTFLNGLHVSQPGALVNELTTVFQGGAFTRSNFFLNFSYREFATRSAAFKSTYRMPVFGAKGRTPNITRNANYVLLKMGTEAEMTSAGINRYVFGGNYLSGEETLNLPSEELIDSQELGGGQPGFTILPEWKKSVTHIVEKLWEASEKEPSTRFVVRVKAAESVSMNLLQQIFLLIPQRLKLQTGFETNIASQDLFKIDNSVVPIYLLTVDENETIAPDQYKMPVVVFDLAKEDKYSYNHERLALISKLADAMDERLLSRLDNAEKAYLRAASVSASSFKYYGDIVASLFDETHYWWKQSYNSVDELKKAYESQADLMSQPEYRKEAVSDLYLDLYSKGNLAADTIDVIANQNYPDRSKLIGFMKKELGQAGLIGAVDGLIDRHQNMLQDQHLKDVWNAEQARQAALESQRASFDEAMNKNQAYVEKLKQEQQNLTVKIDVLEVEGRQLKEDNARLVGENSRLNELVSEDTEENREGLQKARKTINAQKEEINSLKTQRMIFMILSGILGALAIAFLILWILKPASSTEQPHVPTPTPVVQPTVAAEEAESTETAGTEEMTGTEESSEGETITEPTSIPAPMDTEENQDNTTDAAPMLTAKDFAKDIAFISRKDMARRKEAAVGQVSINQRQSKTDDGFTAPENGDGKAEEKAAGETEDQPLEAISYRVSGYRNKQDDSAYIYFHVMFSGSEDGSDMVNAETFVKTGMTGAETYIGTYLSDNDDYNQDPETYVWVPFSGISEDTSLSAKWFQDTTENDVSLADKAAHQTTRYLHIRYFTADETGKPFEFTAGRAAASFIGWYIDDKSEQSDKSTDYEITEIPMSGVEVSTEEEPSVTEESSIEEFEKESQENNYRNPD